MNMVIEALGKFFKPLLKVIKTWPPILAYGVPLMVMLLIITISVTTLPTNLAWLIGTLLTIPIICFFILSIIDRKIKIKIHGSVLIDDKPAEGAKVFIMARNGETFTNSNGNFELEIDEYEDLTLMVLYNGISEKKHIDKKHIDDPTLIKLISPPPPPVEKTGLQIDDVIVIKAKDHVTLDVRLRNNSKKVISISRVNLHILRQDLRRAPLIATGSYDIYIQATDNEIPFAQEIESNHNDRIFIKLGFSETYLSCNFDGLLIFHYNGDQQEKSKKFSFNSVF